jgi:hypothetical protein
MITFGYFRITIGHVPQMGFFLFRAGLVPLGIVPVGGVDLPKGFHRKVKHQLKMGHMTLDLLPFKGLQIPFAFGHGYTIALVSASVYGVSP